MTFALPSLLFAAGLFGGLIWLAHAGLRDGDHPGDVTIAVAVATHPRGPWPAAQVRIVNPGAGTALVSVSAVRRRTPLESLVGDSRGGSPRRLGRGLARRGLGQGQLIAVAAGDETVAEVALPAGARRVAILALVGTEGRLRRHRLELGVPPAPPRERRATVPRRLSRPAECSTGTRWSNPRSPSAGW